MSGFDEVAIDTFCAGSPDIQNAYASVLDAVSVTAIIIPRVMAQEHSLYFIVIEPPFKIYIKVYHKNV